MSTLTVMLEPRNYSWFDADNIYDLDEFKNSLNNFKNHIESNFLLIENTTDNQKRIINEFEKFVYDFFSIVGINIKFNDFAAIQFNTFNFVVLTHPNIVGYVFFCEELIDSNWKEFVELCKQKNRDKLLKIRSVKDEGIK